MLKNGTESHYRRQESETNFNVSNKVSEPSFQVVWPCNIVLSTFSNSKGAYAIHQPSTDSIEVRQAWVCLARGRQNSYLPLGQTKFHREVLSFFAKQRSFRQDKRHLNNTTEPSFYSVELDSSSKGLTTDCKM